MFIATSHEPYVMPRTNSTAPVVTALGVTDRATRQSAQIAARETMTGRLLYLAANRPDERHRGERPEP